MKNFQMQFDEKVRWNKQGLYDFFAYFFIFQILYKKIKGYSMG